MPDGAKKDGRSRKDGKMLDIAVDLLWLRPRQVGGTEFYIRNLLDGFLRLAEPFHLSLMVSRDNKDTFQHYAKDDRIDLLETDVLSANITGRILWQFFCQNRFLKRHGIRKCFTPVYYRTLVNGGITYVNVIHDLQAAHYPKYHPFHEIAYYKLCWWLDTHFSAHLIAISDWVKDDIKARYHVSADRITTIYNPITVDRAETIPFAQLTEKYGIREKEYYYTISQMIPHKNLRTLLSVMEKIKREQIDLPRRLLISGVNGEGRKALEKEILEKELTDTVTLTGFVENEERNALYQNCSAFLFPSVFEGFGMPPVEAMLFGAVVITTNQASIPEVTQGKANYVRDPYDAEEWIRVMLSPKDRIAEMDFSVYDQMKLTETYYRVLREIFV